MFLSVVWAIIEYFSVSHEPVDLNGAREFLRCAIGACNILARIVPDRALDSAHKGHLISNNGKSLL